MKKINSDSNKIKKIYIADETSKFILVTLFGSFAYDDNVIPGNVLLVKNAKISDFRRKKYELSPWYAYCEINPKNRKETNILEKVYRNY